MTLVGTRALSLSLAQVCQTARAKRGKVTLHQLNEASKIKEWTEAAFLTPPPLPPAHAL